VSEARQYRTTRLKAAKTDAAAEIAAYKQKKEQELKQYEAEHSGLNETADKEAEEQVKVELKAIKQTADAKRADVAKLLIDAVTKPTPELHINA
jgi:V-type H+-transporting ATPase subunit G